MDNKKIFVAIMAGGVGSRFWPASREYLPKQFIDILGVGRSLIQLTYDRFRKLVPAENILVLTNKMYAPLVQEHLPDVPKENILGEPSRNNTAPCNALLALKINQQDPDAVLVIAPSDHVILKEEAFITNISKAAEYASQHDALLTLGIKPTRPDTGYGYIEMKEMTDGVTKVEQFREKPDVEKAKEYLQAGNYVWNAGIFIWQTKNILKSFNQNAKQIVDVLSEDLSKLNSREEQAYIDKVYPQTESISIDYAILERAENVYTIPSDIGWSDLGTWNSLHAYLEADDQGNVVLTEHAMLSEVKNSFVKSYSNKMVVIKGLENYIVVDEKDVLLVYPKDDEQEIKSVRKTISEEQYL